MTDKYHFIKTPEGLKPGDETAEALFNDIPNNTNLSLKISMERDMSQHRRLFKILRMTFELWEPPGGLITLAERVGARDYAKWADDKSGNGLNILQSSLDEHFAEKEEKRRELSDAVTKSFDGFYDWIKIEAGIYEPVWTPNGILKRAKSLKVSRMPANKFTECYRALFNVCWQMTLRSHYDTPEECLDALGELEKFAVRD